MSAVSIRGLGLAAACVLWFALDATAQATAQGRVTVDGAIIWRTDSAAPITTVRANTQLDVTAQSNRWYEVVVPESLGGRGDRGLVARSQMQIVSGASAIPMRTLRGDPPAGPPSTTGPAGTAARAGAAQQPRSRRRTPLQGLAFVNGMFQTTSSDFGDAFSFRENAEDAVFDTDYAVRSVRGFSGGAGVMFSPRFGLGASVEHSTTNTPAVLTGAIPHPFFFDAARNISGDIAELEREELVLHGEFRVAWPLSTRLQVSALGGPSLFRVTQGIVSDVRYTESYPYDEARFSGADTVTATQNRLGFNVGGDAAFYFTRQFGVGARITFSRAVLKLPTTDDRETEVEAGGVRTGVGLRVRF